MGNTRTAIVAVALGVSLFTAACSNDSGSSSATTAGAVTTGATSVAPKVGVILPDTTSSARWETADRPFLAEAFEAAGVDYDIKNAEGDKARMATLADQMITDGVDVLMLVNLDSESGAAIQQKAADAGVKTIDYDRLTANGSAAVYVSFDDVEVGELQGQGLVDCVDATGTKNPRIVVLNGPPTDSNVAQLAQGYNSVIRPKFDSGDWTLVDDQSVPDPQSARAVFEQMLAKAGGKVDGVLATNDFLAGSAIAVLQQNDLKVPVTGQDATVDGLRNILTGDQCMTVYTPVKAEADAAAATAIALATGREPATTGSAKDVASGREVPAVLVAPVAITIDDITVPIDDELVSADDVCRGLEQQCKKAGIG